MSQQQRPREYVTHKPSGEGREGGGTDGGREGRGREGMGEGGKREGRKVRRREGEREGGRPSPHSALPGETGCHMHLDSAQFL